MTTTDLFTELSIRVDVPQTSHRDQVTSHTWWATFGIKLILTDYPSAEGYNGRSRDITVEYRDRGVRTHTARAEDTSDVRAIADTLESLAVSAHPKTSDILDIMASCIRNHA